MKLCRFGAADAEAPGIVIDENGKAVRIDVSAFGEDFGEAFFGSGGIERLSGWLKHNRSKCPVVAQDIRVAPPIMRPSKIVCVGLNYADHAKETGSAAPVEPVIFAKSTTAMCGANDAIEIPPGGHKTDWEVELAVVIGRRAKQIAVNEAAAHVAGACIMNDVSERAFQKERGGQFIKGKSADTFAPFGPYLATLDELPPLGELNLWLDLNGTRVQDGSTADMIFDPFYLVSYISQFMTLLPGDVISTGTPAGVGAGMTPPRFLRPGDELAYGATALGQCTQRVVA